MVIRHGVNRRLEDRADRLIASSMRGDKAHSSRSDIITPSKARKIQDREVQTRTGTPDPNFLSGIYRRSAHPGRPDLNSRVRSTSSLRGHVDRDYSGSGGSIYSVFHPDD